MDQTAWDERYAGPELVWGAGPNCFVTEELAALEPGRALDLGTGEGRNAIWLAARGWQVTGVDFSAVGLARAAELARQRGVDVGWVKADLLSYQPSPAGYDLVLIAYIQLPADELARWSGPRRPRSRRTGRCWPSGTIVTTSTGVTAARSIPTSSGHPHP